MTELGFAAGVIDDGQLAVSELAGNAWKHAAPSDGLDPIVPVELWFWIRLSQPAPALVVSVFDTCHGVLPAEPTHGALMDEHGKGLTVVEAVTADWGSNRTRSRLGSWLVPGKRVWFTLPLPPTCSVPSSTATPQRTARRLLLALGARGLGAATSVDLGTGQAEVTIGETCVQVTRQHLLVNSPGDIPSGHDPRDVCDVAELIAQQHEEDLARRPTPSDTREPRPKGSDRPAG